MDYVLRVSPLAEQQLAAQPEPLRAFITAALEQLARGPSAFTRPSALVTRGQLAEFKFDRAGAVVWVSVTFLYGQDEQTLFVEHIAAEFGG
jgi:hypothetical protein